MRPSPLAIFAAFCIGLEAIVGLCLGLSNGLSETHKSVLVGFIVAFPALTLLIFLPLLTRAQRLENEWYYPSADQGPVEGPAPNLNAA